MNIQNLYLIRAPTARSREIADRVEVFVRDIVMPFEGDLGAPRTG